MRVMVVDEDNERRAILREGLERAGHEVVGGLQPVANLSRLVLELQPDVIIIDTHSPGSKNSRRCAPNSRMRKRSLLTARPSSAPRVF